MITRLWNGLERTLRLVFGPAARALKRRERRFLVEAARYGTALAITNDRGCRYLFDSRDEVIGRALFINGSYGTQVLEAALAVLATKHFEVRQLIDIGANIGVTSIEVLSRMPKATAVAIEPDVRNFSLLQDNLALNGLQHRVRTLQYALSDRAGNVEFEMSDSNFGDHRIRMTNASGAFDEQVRPTAVVEARRFDELHDSGLIEISQGTLVNLDTQGHEAHVLSGGLALLTCPLVVEFWPYGLRRAGGFDRFLKLISGYSSITRLDDGSRIRSVDDLAAIDLGVQHIDLLLLPP